MRSRKKQELTRWVTKTTKAITGTAEASGRSCQRSTVSEGARSVPWGGARIELTEADDDVPGEVGHVREEDERAADADDADQAEDRDAQEQRERDLEGVVRLVQRAPVLVEHRADVD